MATANPAGHLDASHRGGHPGFVRVGDDGRLWIPDYPGNSMFMTLGNLALYPAAGLLFLDFAGGQALQVTGTTVLDLDVPGGAAANTGGTGRAWTLTPTSWRRTPLPRSVQAAVLDYSPHNPR